jgi:hypothetical protein
MNHPYNTGKVAIGSAYNPVRPVHHDRDALRLQRALLGEKRPSILPYIILACLTLPLLLLL